MLSSLRQSPVHFPRTFALVGQTLSPGAVAPLNLPAGPVLWLSVPGGRRPGQACWGAAESRPRSALAVFLAAGGGAQRALQGGGGAARTGRRAEEHPAAVLHQLGQTRQEVCVTGAAGAHS